MTRRAVAVRHVPFEDLGLIAPVLADRGYDVQYLDVSVDPLGRDAFVRADVVIVLGGPIGVYETQAYPFLADERAAIAARLRQGGPVLGVCLGAQLIASAMGADVTATGRQEIGYGTLSLTPHGRASVLAPLADLPVLHWHGDQFTIPDGASRLAETPGFPNQAFSSGDDVLALQFHLEADHTRIEQWLIGHAHELATAGIDPRRIRSDAARFGPALAVAAQDVLHDWLAHLSN